MTRIEEHGEAACGPNGSEPCRLHWEFPVLVINFNFEGTCWTPKLGRSTLYRSVRRGISAPPHFSGADHHISKRGFSAILRRAEPSQQLVTAEMSHALQVWRQRYGIADDAYGELLSILALTNEAEKYINSDEIFVGDRHCYPEGFTNLHDPTASIHVNTSPLSISGTVPNDNGLQIDAFAATSDSVDAFLVDSASVASTHSLISQGAARYAIRSGFENSPDAPSSASTHWAGVGNFENTSPQPQTDTGHEHAIFSTSEQGLTADAIPPTQGLRKFHTSSRRRPCAKCWALKKRVSLFI